MLITLFPNNNEFLVGLSVCLLAYFLTEIKQIYGYLKFCMNFLSDFLDTFLWCWHTTSHNYGIILCFSVCLLAYFLTELRQIEGYIQFWMRYLSDVFRRHSRDILHYFKIITNCLYVCQSVYWHTFLLKLC